MPCDQKEKKLKGRTRRSIRRSELRKQTSRYSSSRIVCAREGLKKRGNGCASLARFFGIVTVMMVMSMFLFWIPSSWSSTVNESPIIAKASWYSTECCKYNSSPSCPTASGKSLYALEKEGVMFCASYAYPLGTRLKVSRRGSKRHAIVVVQDRGPAKRLGRRIDLCKRAFEKIAPLSEGIIQVRIERLP